MSKTTLSNLPSTLADDLATFAVMQGRDWKRKLVMEWGLEASPEWMHTLKANYGPAWLFGVKL